MDTKNLFATLALGFAGISLLNAQAVPNTIAGLDIWLTDAGNTFDGTTWTDSSVNSNNATAVGFRAGSDTGGSTPNFPDATYLAGTASTQFSTAGVAFSGSADDLMSAGSTFSGLTDVTFFVVYSTSQAGSEVRPAGIGSQAAAGQATSAIFNMATDGSLRYDNGRNDGSAANPTGSLLVRASRLDSGAVTDWLDSGSGLAVNIGPTSTVSGGTGIPNPLGSDGDAFYLGDVRAGSTRVGGSDPNGTTVSADLFISQIAVYRRALTDQEVSDVAIWMADNPGAIPEPSTYALLGGLAALAGVMIRRRMR